MKDKGLEEIIMKSISCHLRVLVSYFINDSKHLLRGERDLAEEIINKVRKYDKQQGYRSRG